MGGPVASSSKKLAHVGLSAFHNEYMALWHAAAFTMWMRQLLDEIGMHHMNAKHMTIYGDNMAANKLTKEDFISTGNQYIYVPYHWIKELVKSNHITVLYKNTKDNFADLFTKPVTREVITSLLHKMLGYNHNW